MDAIWITLGMALAMIGGWPVTAGILKLAKSKTVRAVDASEAAAGDTAETVLPADAPALPTDAPALPTHAPVVPADAPAVPTAAPGLAQDTPAPSPDGVPGNGVPVDGVSGAGDATPPSNQHPEAEVLRGGLLIGFLERAAVAVAIFAGQPVAIAYVVAIKGLGRYPELKATPAASERFIIGTLASMLFSAGVAVLVKVLLL